MRWMNLEPIIQSEVCQKQKNKYCILIHTYEKKKDSDFDSGKIIVHRLGKVRFWLVKTIIEIQAHWGRSKVLKYNVCSGLFPSKRCVCMRCETLLKAFPFLTSAGNIHRGQLKFFATVDKHMNGHKPAMNRFRGHNYILMSSQTCTYRICE